MPVSMSVRVEGMEEMQRFMKKYPTLAKREYGKAVQGGAQALRDSTKAHARIPVDTGRMRQSVGKRKIRALQAAMFVGVDYAKYVHEGTSRMIKRPFVDWALRDGGMKRINDLFAKATKRILRQAR